MQPDKPFSKRSVNQRCSAIRRRWFLAMTWVVLVVFCAIDGRAAQPNILLILADDLGYGDVGCYNPEAKAPTPNLDRLAREGMRFTDAHSPSTVCTPTRYSILTGRMGVGEAHALLRQPVEVGRLEGRVGAEARRLAVAQIVKQDEDDVGFGRLAVLGWRACGHCR